MVPERKRERFESIWYERTFYVEKRRAAVFCFCFVEQQTKTNSDLLTLRAFSTISLSQNELVHEKEKETKRNINETMLY